MEEPAHLRIAEIRLACECRAQSQRRRVDLAAEAFRRSLQSVASKAADTISDLEKLRNLKERLRDSEEDLGHALSAKTCKEVTLKSARESLAAAKARTAELRKTLQDQRAKKNEYEAIIAQQLLALEALDEKSNRENIDRESLVEAISWYNTVLGFRTEGGEGVKFIFNKIDWKNPEKEFSFTIRLEGDTYSCLQCDPVLKDITDLVKELNQTNGLYKFVRVMREKFKKAALNENLSATCNIPQDLSAITVSSPPPVTRDSTTESSKENNFDHSKERQSALARQRNTKSPLSISAPRRSSRLRNGS